jgi:hypothetical protein
MRMGTAQRERAMVDTAKRTPKREAALLRQALIALSMGFDLVNCQVMLD